MALRIVLLGLVVGMGAELPSADRFEAWASKGKQLASSVWDEFQSLRSGTEADADRAQIEARKLVAKADKAFDEAMDAVAKDFTADLAMIEKAREPEQVATEIAQLDEQGVDDAAAVEVAMDSDFPAGPNAMDVDAVEEVADEQPEQERLSSAVKLTREAMGAWLELLSKPSTR